MTLGELISKIDQAVVENYTEAMNLQTKLFRAGQDAGELRDGDPEVLAMLFSGVLSAYQSTDPTVVTAADATERMTLDRAPRDPRRRLRPLNSVSAPAAPAATAMARRGFFQLLVCRNAGTAPTTGPPQCNATGSPGSCSTWIASGGIPTRPRSTTSTRPSSSAGIIGTPRRERGDRRDGAEHESLLAHGDLDAAAEHQHARVGERSGIGAVEADEVGPAFGSQRLRTRWCRIDAEQRAEDTLRGDRHGLTAAVREHDDTDTVVRRDGERGDEARDPSAVTDGAMTADIVTEERQSNARMGRARLIVRLERHRERLGLHDAPPVVEQRGRVRRHVGQGREDPNPRVASRRRCPAVSADRAAG